MHRSHSIHSSDNIVVHTRDGVDHLLSDLAAVPLLKQESLFPDMIVPTTSAICNSLASSLPCMNAVSAVAETASVICTQSESTLQGHYDVILGVNSTESHEKIESSTNGASFSTPPDTQWLYPPQLFKSKSLYSPTTHPEEFLHNDSHSSALLSRPPFAKNLSENHIFISPARRRSSIGTSPFSESKTAGLEGYIRRRQNTVDSLNIEVVSSNNFENSTESMSTDQRLINNYIDSPNSNKQRRASDNAIRSWRERRNIRKSVVTLTSVSMHAIVGTALIQGRHEKIDSDDDTNYSISTNNTPIKVPLTKLGKRSSFVGSELSELSPPSALTMTPSSQSPGILFYDIQDM